MTVASEISRLQCAKADICTAIENKGVTVGNITLDEYACCVDAIQQGGGGMCIDALIVGGGGGGIGSTNSIRMGGGGGGGGVLVLDRSFVEQETCVVVGVGGCGVPYTGLGENNGGDSCFGDHVALGGGGGGGGNGGSGGGGSGLCASSAYSIPGGSGKRDYNGFIAQGCDGGAGMACKCASSVRSGGGGGAWKAGSSYNGGSGLCSCIDGTEACYAGGGGGVYYSTCQGSVQTGSGASGGGNGVYNGCGCDATTYGSGGGGSAGGGSFCGGNGCQGIVIVRYPTDGSYGINSSCGGNCCYTCNGYCIHKFTSNGTFTVVS